MQSPSESTGAAAQEATALHAPAAVTAALRAYAAAVLAGTDCTLDEVTAIACGAREAAQDSPLAAVADALRAGWSATERVHGQSDGGQRAQHDTERGDAPAPRPDLPEDQR
ncbi:hypothetical protein [Kineococcus gypseus]|uniref:hypothetical protein n=1 Tax=Kineococcus gypseus TaxID=1637102 RepID=UPI003D7DF3C2